MTGPLCCLLISALLFDATDASPQAEADDPTDQPGALERVEAPEAALTFGTTLLRDYKAFYTGRRLLTLGSVMAAGGLLANSDADQSLFQGYRDLRGERSDGWAHRLQPLGDADVVLPVVIVPALLIGLGDRPDESTVGAWWRRSARAYAVGGPSFYYLQQISGGSRPGHPEGSAWRPFIGNHGISGHAFLAAVPFLTAARLSERPLTKGAWIAASILPGLARLEQEKHFPSQVVLGWILAWEATGAVAEASEGTRQGWKLAAIPVPAERGGAVVVAISLP
jgi:membrane-associated phospholipid phosphatase